MSPSSTEPTPEPASTGRAWRSGDFVLDGARASWIVRPDGSVTGVQFNGGISGRDFEQAELRQLDAAQFQSLVRNTRILQQAMQQISLQNGALTSRINRQAGPFPFNSAGAQPLSAVAATRSVASS